MLQEHAEDVKYVVWKPDGEVLASASYDNTIKMWKDDDGDWFCFQTLVGHTSTVWAIDFNQSGDILVSVGDDHTVRIWNLVVGTWQLHDTLTLTHTLYSVSWSKITNIIAVCGSDNKIRLIEISSDGKAVAKETITNPHGLSDVNHVVWCPLANFKDLLISSGDDSNVKIWQMYQ